MLLKINSDQIYYTLKRSRRRMKTQIYLATVLAILAATFMAVNNNGYLQS